MITLETHDEYIEYPSKNKNKFPKLYKEYLDFIFIAEKEYLPIAFLTNGQDPYKKEEKFVNVKLKVSKEDYGFTLNINRIYEAIRFAPSPFICKIDGKLYLVGKALLIKIKEYNFNLDKEIKIEKILILGLFNKLKPFSPTNVITVIDRNSYKNAEKNIKKIFKLIIDNEIDTFITLKVKNFLRKDLTISAKTVKEQINNIEKLLLICTKKLSNEQFNIEPYMQEPMKNTNIPVKISPQVVVPEGIFVFRTDEQQPFEEKNEIKIDTITKSERKTLDEISESVNLYNEFISTL